MHGSFLYEALPPGSPLRTIVADTSAWYSCLERIEFIKKSSHLSDKAQHPDFVMDVLQALARRFMSMSAVNSPLLGWETSCKYHSHNKEKICYREKLEGHVYDLNFMFQADQPQFRLVREEASSVRRRPSFRSQAAEMKAKTYVRSQLRSWSRSELRDLFLHKTLVEARKAIDDWVLWPRRGVVGWQGEREWDRICRRS
ncbi:hypothetical protein BU23DRAFT_575945 [Bimuria novae-zelandiae CBS 107.79]|uniref:Uncharacterized protein n=1 Tax=Bimuria novae-zelandiae CBS 107.79 TaxID=1447943 RepID=A0A6A5UK17_9PLEO|nr:hypothetical protein BU23DRAFT_575945 [Bimuria novae-zelandiae CBS 107.79]